MSPTTGCSLPPRFEDGFDLVLKALSGKTSSLQPTLYLGGLLQLNDLLGQLVEGREEELGDREDPALS